MCSATISFKSQSSTTTANSNQSQHIVKAARSAEGSCGGSFGRRTHSMLRREGMHVDGQRPL